MVNTIAMWYTLIAHNKSYFWHHEHKLAACQCNLFCCVHIHASIDFANLLYNNNYLNSREIFCYMIQIHNCFSWLQKKTIKRTIIASLYLCTVYKLISMTVWNCMCSLKVIYFHDTIVSHIIMLVTVTVHYLCSRSADHCNVTHLEAVKVCVSSRCEIKGSSLSSSMCRQALLVHGRRNAHFFM